MVWLLMLMMIDDAENDFWLMMGVIVIVIW